MTDAEVVREPVQPDFTAAVFDGAALVAQVEAKRVASGQSWRLVAQDLTDLSSTLRAELGDHAVCPGALQRTVRRGSMSCQYALMLLQWLGRQPEDFLTCQRREIGDPRLPVVGTDARLRWDLAQLHAAVNARRLEDGLTWGALAARLGTTPTRLTNLRTARQADMDLTMRLTQWLGRPAAAFVHAADW